VSCTGALTNLICGDGGQFVAVIEHLATLFYNGLAPHRMVHAGLDVGFRQIKSAFLRHIA
jgi:hypothetical protein